MSSIDINCDLGESYGAYRIGNDEGIIPFVTSVNIACGFHAGDPTTMRKTVKLALENKVAIGAHPGFNDVLGFGRREINISPNEIYDLVVYQIGALEAIVKSEGGAMQHVKPHGALYNMAAKDIHLAEAIAKAVYKVNPEYILFGLANSEIIRAGKRYGLNVANEVFADRTYQSDGSLTPRTQEQALIHDPNYAAKQILHMVKEKKVVSVQEEEIPIQADTICIHGDSNEGLSIVKTIRKTLLQSNISIQNFKQSEEAGI
ncbi:LamB/YcsF family protein [Bacillus sp. 522_BSPC]|uniref:LamB/YcsF family protein n=1 Tax=Bacillus sp. 522_BSPC TaxID=1579338 RepID=UPI0006608E90|nr:5-oxoprolinase subunit PxpA [Bacillus sp. 522_BSPC]